MSMNIACDSQEWLFNNERKEDKVAKEMLLITANDSYWLRQIRSEIEIAAGAKTEHFNFCNNCKIRVYANIELKYCPQCGLSYGSAAK